MKIANERKLTSASTYVFPIFQSIMTNVLRLALQHLENPTLSLLRRAKCRTMPCLDISDIDRSPALSFDEFDTSLLDSCRDRAVLFTEQVGHRHIFVTGVRQWGGEASSRMLLQFSRPSFAFFRRHVGKRGRGSFLDVGKGYPAFVLFLLRLSVRWKLV